MIRAIALVSNEMSASMLRSALEHDKIDLSEVCLISGRMLTQDWVLRTAEFIQFSQKASLTFFGQTKALGFYIKAVAALKRWLRHSGIERLYIVNSDNLLNNHVLRWAERHPSVRLSVLVEGNMNFHEVTKKNRAWWRWPMKPPMALLFGLRYRPPQGHLSAAFEERVDRVVSYAEQHLKAPLEKVLVLPLPAITVTARPDADTILVLITGIKQWMSAADFELFKIAFTSWINGLGAKRVLVKLHPNYPSGDIEKGINGFEYFDERRPLEVIAGEISASLIVGYWTTGLISLKLLRPELRCIDFGSDFYSRAAYHGDGNLAAVLEGAGVELVMAEPYLPPAASEIA